MMFHLLSLLILSLCTSSNYFTSATILYNDGQIHTIATNINEAILLRTSSTLILPSGDYTTIRSPSDYSAIQLQMSSTLNATGGDIMGGDASSDHPIPGAGIIVGSASTAILYEGVTVRGGNNGVAANDNIIYYDEYDIDYQNRGGDALVSQYFGSNITIHGGKFIAGSGGSIKDGYSLHCHGEAQIHVHGGSFYGSWKVNDRGSIVVTGCVNRIGSRLVGRLQSGQSLDVQLTEENGGKVIIENREKCNTYNNKNDTTSSASHTGMKKMTRSTCLLFGLIICYLSF